MIVTSSSHLLGTKLGPEIERAECTIRMNDAPTTGYSADVGNKTTFRVVAHSSVYRVLKRPQEFVNRTPDTVFIFWGPPNKMQKPQGSLVRIIQRAGLVFPNMEAYAVSPGRMRQFDDLFRGETGKDRYQPSACPLWPALCSSQHALCRGPVAPSKHCSEGVVTSRRPLVRVPGGVLFMFSTSHFQHALHDPSFPGGLSPSIHCSERRVPSMLFSKTAQSFLASFLGELPVACLLESIDYSCASCFRHTVAPSMLYSKYTSLPVLL